MGHELLDHIQQMPGAEDFNSRNKRRFLRTFGRQHQPHVVLLALQSQRCRQRAAYRAQGTGQRQLAGKLIVDELGRFNLPAGGQNAQRNRQVKPAGVFGQVRRSKVDGDSFVVGKFQPCIHDGSAHALPGFFDFDVRQTHQRERRQAVGQMDFNRNTRCLQTQQGTTLNQSQTHRHLVDGARCTSIAKPWQGRQRLRSWPAGHFSPELHQNSAATEAYVKKHWC